MTPNQRLLLLAALAVVLSGGLAVLLRRFRVTPAERERRRRLYLNRHGRMTDGVLTDVQDATVYYSYSIAGVAYAASQDLSAVGELLRGEAGPRVGPVTLKYLPRNPANSIVACEEWSGLRGWGRAHVPAGKRAVPEAK